jgi:predicted O-methyltransferase YrrM
MAISIGIEKALAIKGWMTDHELTWLAEQATHYSHIMEVGCAYGRSTRALADNTVGRVYAVDTWQGSPDELDTNHQDYALRNGDEVFIQFCENLWERIIVGWVVPIRMRSENAARVFLAQNRHIGFGFIDGDHTYESVLQDVTSLIPLLSKYGGLIAGHDYDSSNWPGVKEAVDELFPNVEVAPLTHIWFAHIPPL